MLFFPGLAMNLITRTWAPSIDATGYLPEYAARGGLAPLHGRFVASQDPGFIIETYQVWLFSTLKCIFFEGQDIRHLDSDIHVCLEFFRHFKLQVTTAF